MCVLFHFTNNYFYFHYDYVSSPYESILEKVFTEWEIGSKGEELVLILFIFVFLIRGDVYFEGCRIITVIFKTNEKGINKKSNKNFILLPSVKLIYFLKLVELRILQYALLCGEKQKKRKQFRSKM